MEITFKPISVDKLDRAEKAIFKCVQQESFAEVITGLRFGKTQRKQNNCLFKLNPIISDGILRVGGRLQ